MAVSSRMPAQILATADRVDDEVLARAAALVGVALAGEHERALDRLALEPREAGVLVLLDYREQVGEKVALELVELDARRRDLGLRTIHAAIGEVDRRGLVAAVASVRALRRRHESSLDPGLAARDLPERGGEMARSGLGSMRREGKPRRTAVSSVPEHGR